MHHDNNGNSLVYVGYNSVTIERTSVTFRYHNDDAKSVSLRGTMNNWDETKMEKDAKGIWSVTLDLTPREYQYKFYINNADWKNDPGNTDPQIGGNNVFTVPEPEPDPLPTVSPEIDGNEITFWYVDESASSVFLTGTMYGWADVDKGAKEMESNGKGVWSATVPLGPGKYEYKFIVNGNTP